MKDAGVVKKMVRILDRRIVFNPGVIMILKIAGRIGFIFHGLIFFSIGIMSFIFVYKLDRAVGFKAAMQDLLSNTFGQFLVIIMAIGLIGFAIWRFLQAFFDTEEKGSSFIALFIRFVYVLIGLFYIWLSYSLTAMVFGKTGEHANIQIAGLIAMLLNVWYGPWILGIAVLIICGIGIYQFYLTFTGAFQDTLLRNIMSEQSWKTLDILGRIGFAARGIVFVGIGVLLALATYYHQPKEAGLQAEVITAMTTHMGRAIGMILSAGLIVFSFYEMSNVRYRYIFRSEKEES